MKTIDEFGNIIIDNEPERYCYQYGDDVRDLIWTIEIEKIRNVLDKGTTLVMVHLYRHYLLCRGYIAHPLPGGKYSYLYVFNDSAGDMKLPLNLRLSSSGEKVIYPVSFLNNKQFYGGCYEVFV